MELKPNEEMFDISPVGIRYKCEICGEGEMIVDSSNPVILATKPALFPHICNKCGAKMSLPKSYPYIEWIRTEVSG